MSNVHRETLLWLRKEIEPLARQILCPADNVFSRMITRIDRALAAPDDVLEALKAIDDALADPNSATRKGYLTRTIKQVREVIAKAERRDA